MPLVAIDADSGAHVDLTRARYPERLRARRWRCPQCGATLYVRRSPRGLYHFVHTTVGVGRPRPCSESEAHVAAKALFAAWLREAWPEEAGARVELEALLTEAGRVADVLVTFPDGWRLAIEIQLASASPAELEVRTKSYRRCAIDVVWVLGRRANTAGNRDWCRRQYGFSTILRFRGRVTPATGGEPRIQGTEAWVVDGADRRLGLASLRRGLIGLRRFRQWLRRHEAWGVGGRVAAGPAWLTRWGVVLFSLSGHR